MPEVEQQTFKDLIFYLYKGYTKQESDLTGLLTLADKYHTLELKCKYEMTPGIRVDYTSCVELLALADLHECLFLSRGTKFNSSANSRVKGRVAEEDVQGCRSRRSMHASLVTTVGCWGIGPTTWSSPTTKHQEEEGCVRHQEAPEEVCSEANCTRLGGNSSNG